MNFLQVPGFTNLIRKSATSAPRGCLRSVIRAGTFATMDTQQPVPLAAGQTPGAHLRQVRIREGLSQSRVALMLNVTPASVGGWERDEYKPSIAIALQLNRYLGVAPSNWGYTQEQCTAFLRSLRPARRRTRKVAS